MNGAPSLRDGPRKLGLGDQLIATGLARGACMRGKRIAFGDTVEIKWDSNSAAIFARNPNIAPPGSERDRDLEWIRYYKGNRIYNRQDVNRWAWNYGFRVRAGAIYFTHREKNDAVRYGARHVLIEPNVAPRKPGAMNKDWPRERYQAVADALQKAGRRVVQFDYGLPLLDGVSTVPTRTFRDALAVLANAALYIGPEGGLHHGAAAVGIPAVVIFGGWIPPAITGYGGHINLTGGEEDACGRFDPCLRCRAALERISVEEVLEATELARRA